MKTTIFNKKALAFFGAAAILLAAVFTIGCKTDTGSGDPAPETFAVAFSVDGGNGKLKAKADGVAETTPSPITVEKGKTVTFTATPKNGYKVDKWTITGGAFEAGTGTEGSLTAKVKITANTKVNVSFKTAMYTEVPFGPNGANLNHHLRNTAPHTDGIYYIKVTGLTAADLKGDSDSRKPSPLGKILNDNPTKKVALKLSEVSGLTDMSACFVNCKSLTQAPEIPNGVTNMQDCFLFCTSLTQAPVIPSSVTNMIGCFAGCKSLIQAPVIPSGVTNMQACFAGCKSLTQAPVIPSNVTNMYQCFFGCTSLTQAPEIPSKVTNMHSCFEGCKNITAVTLKCNYVHGSFNYAFSHCSSLSAGSIKVPAGQVKTYKDNAATMGTEPDRFVAE